MKEINVRVYGWLFREDLGVLTSVEDIKGKYYRKFPGGGLKWGEGIDECVIREYKEETGIDIYTGEQLYTTHFFQQSAFNENHQVISIYLEVHNSRAMSKESALQLKSIEEHEDISFEWIPLHKLDEEMFPLPIDQEFVRRMKQSFQ